MIALSYIESEKANIMLDRIIICGIIYSEGDDFP